MLMALLPGLSNLGLPSQSHTTRVPHSGLAEALQTAEIISQSIFASELKFRRCNWQSGLMFALALELAVSSEVLGKGKCKLSFSLSSKRLFVVLVSAAS